MLQVTLTDEMMSDEIHVEQFPFTLGRHPACDAQILHPLISRQHCRLYLNDGELWVRDLESRNGTLLNGEELEQPQPLRNGDVLCIPLHEFQVKVEQTSSQLLELAT